MAVFQSSDELYGVMGPFLDTMLADPELRGKFVKANTSFKVQYTAPDALFLMDCTVDPPVVYTGDDASAREAEVGLTMTADDGHRFWLGKLNIPVALAKKKVSISGALTKLMGLLPALAPAFGKYKIFLKEQGREDLL